MTDLTPSSPSLSCSDESDNINVAPMPILIKSTYQQDYVPPKHRIKYILKELVEKSLPVDYLPVDSGKRILPTTYRDIYRNSISASISEMLDLKFLDDTPQWKLDKRKPIDRNWLHPLDERKDFIKTQEWYLRMHSNKKLNNATTTNMKNDMIINNIDCIDNCKEINDNNIEENCVYCMC